jgi:DNA-binding response OmpR family regulator
MKRKELKIVFVDDEEMTLELAEAILRKNGYTEIGLFKTGTGFLEHYENKYISPPDIVFLDIKLLDIDGLEILERAYQSDKFSQTVFVSLIAYISNIDRNWLELSGFDDILLKPLDEERLIKKTDTLLIKRDQKTVSHVSKRADSTHLELSRLSVEKEKLEKDYIKRLISPEVYREVPINIGIGVTCGIAAVGIFGAPGYRIQYSILGSPVNLASRLCSVAKKGEIIIGDSIIEHCRYDVDDRRFCKSKGFDHKIEVGKLIIPEDD